MGSTQRSTVASSGPPLVPFFPLDGSKGESEKTKAIIKSLDMLEHIEGGYYVETDRDPLKVPSPFPRTPEKSDTRSASTTIFYLLTPKSNVGCFHRNRARTVHTLHSGRGRYVIIHADEVGNEEDNPGGYGAAEGIPEGKRWLRNARVETFIVGHDIQKGERLQWIVEGGKYKCSYLLPDEEGGDSSEGLLISETVVPGFEYTDHDFMREDRLKALVTTEQFEEMKWMLRDV